MKKSWKVLRKRTVFKNKWRRIDQWTVRRPDGVSDEYFFGVNQDVVIVFGVDKEGNAVLTNQHYIFLGKKVLSITAGYIDNETPLSAAKRELLEETGYAARQWKKVGVSYYGKWQTNTVHYYLATECYKQSEQKLESSEDIDVVLMPVAKLKMMLGKGVKTDTLCLNGMYLGLNRLKML